MQLICIQTANNHKPYSHWMINYSLKMWAWFVFIGCLNAYELHAASPDMCQIAVPLMSHSLSFAVCICFLSFETFDYVGFLDTVPMSGSDCCGIRIAELPCSLSLKCCLTVGLLHAQYSDFLQSCLVQVCAVQHWVQARHQEGRQDLADCIWQWVQVQQCSVALNEEQQPAAHCLGWHS